MKTPPAAKNMRFALADPKCLLKKEGDTHTIQVSWNFLSSVTQRWTVVPGQSRDSSPAFPDAFRVSYDRDRVWKLWDKWDREKTSRDRPDMVVLQDTLSGTNTRGSVPSHPMSIPWFSDIFWNFIKTFATFLIVWQFRLFRNFPLLWIIINTDRYKPKITFSTKFQISHVLYYSLWNNCSKLSRTDKVFECPVVCTCDNDII